MQCHFLIDDVLCLGDIRNQVVKLCEIAPKFDVFGPPNFGGAPKFLAEFYKSESLTTMWQSLVTIGQATSEVRWQKKKKESKKEQNISRKTEWPAASYSWRAAITYQSRQPILIKHTD